MSSRYALPTHAYIPGKTSRHHAEAFDDLRRTAQAGMPAAQLQNSDAFRAGLQYAADGYFWEAHEVLEPVWMLLPKDSDEELLLRLLIQLANANLKLRMDRPKAALRLCEIAGALATSIGRNEVMGIDIADMERTVTALSSNINLHYKAQ